MNDNIFAPPPAAPPWRRRTLLGGGLLIGSAAAAGAWRAVSTGMLLQDDAAFHPWRAWAQAPAGDPVSLVAAAVLASSPHNTQPWLFRLQAGQIEVFADPDRSLGAMDPFGREMWHGVGAAIANIEIAGPALGFGVETLIRPDAGNEYLAARLVLHVGAQPMDPLAAFIDRRSTNRAAYDPTRPPPPSVLDAALDADDTQVRVVWLPAASASGRLFAEATLAGTLTISSDPEMAQAGHHWFRANPRQVAHHRDGVSTPTAGISPLVAKLSPLAPPVDSSTAGRYWLRSTEMHLATAPMFGLILVRDLYNRSTQLLAGARWQRLHLQLTQQGLAAHPMNQLIEVVDRDRQLGRASNTERVLTRLSGDAQWRPTFAFRIGYATREVPHSARRPPTAVIQA